MGSTVRELPKIRWRCGRVARGSCTGRALGRQGEVGEDEVDGIGGEKGEEFEAVTLVEANVVLRVVVDDATVELIRGGALHFVQGRGEFD